jgi:hypothetical protein
MFVKRPDALAYSTHIPVLPIPTDIRERHCIESAFSPLGETPAITAPGVIVLDSPRNTIDTNDHASAVIDTLLQRLSCEGTPTYFRPHPRSQNMDPITNTEVIQLGAGFWELACHEKAIGESVLIGISSTAQLSPVLEANSKPILILLHRICMEEGEPDYATAESIFIIAKRLYGDLNMRVHAPATLDAVFTILKNSGFR